MKKYLFLIVVLGIVICGKTEACINGKINNIKSITMILNHDTLKYLRDNIISHKDRFIHKPLNVMLNELHLNVKYYEFMHSLKPGGPHRGILLYFEDSNAIRKKNSRLTITPSLGIYFDDEISRDSSDKIHYDSEGKWLEAEKDFYGKMMVKDIKGAGQ